MRMCGQTQSNPMDRTCAGEESVRACVVSVGRLRHLIQQILNAVNFRAAQHPHILDCVCS